MDFKEEILKVLKKEIKEEINLEIPPDPDLGDYAFPCFSLAKIYKKNPNQIALELSMKIKAPFLEKVEAQGPYLNFFIARKLFCECVLKDVLKKDYFKKKNKGKILIEHTSINPNASPHVGRARNAIIGDSLKRLFDFLGYKVETHYYVNDVSKQIAMMTLNCTGKEKFSDLLKKYQEISKKIEENPELEKEVFNVLNKFEKGDKKTNLKIKKIVDIAVDGQKKILSEFGIKFDYFDYESKYLKESTNALKELEKTGKLFTDEEGRKVLDQRGTGLEKNMKNAVLVLTRNDGTGLYPLRDIAYTLDKMKKAENNIIVLGEDQKLYFLQLKEALKLLKKKAPDVAHYSFVLIQGKEGPTKMSTRKGDVVLFEDFMKEAREKASKEILERKTKGSPEIIGYGAVKYAIIKNDPNKNILFKMEEALSFDGDTGPYLQYSYARASSILRKSKKKPGLNFKIKNIDETIKLVKILSEFPRIIEHAEEQRDPSLVAKFSFQLAQSFNELYHHTTVIGSAQEDFLVSLTAAFKEVLKKSLNILGIETLEEM